MHILVINSGSSSIKWSMYCAEGPVLASIFEGEASGLDTDGAKLRFADASGTDWTNGRALRPGAGTAEAIQLIADAVVQPGMPHIDAVGYRVVHTGPKLTAHSRVTQELLEELRRATEFAPLHEPGAIRIMEEMQARFPEPASLCVLRYGLPRDDA